MTRQEILDAMNAEIKEARSQSGPDICTDLQVLGRYAWFTFMPDSPQGYTIEVDLETGESHHKGRGQGCFWTDWQATY